MDCTYKTPEGIFNYRAGAIIISKGHLLAVKNIVDPYYYSVGGRVHFGETSEQAVLREAFEETHIHFEIDRLGFIHENIFTQAPDTRIHEICFFYYMKEVADAFRRCAGQTDQGVHEMLEWLPLDSLKDIELYPEFLRTELKKPSRELRHIVTI